MRNLIIVLGLLVFSFSTALSQKPTADQIVQDVFNGLQSVSAIQTMVQMKKQAIESVEMLNGKQLTPEQVEELKTTYNLFKNEFNGVINNVCGDVIANLSKTNYNAVQNKFQVQASVLNESHSRLIAKCAELEGKKAGWITLVIDLFTDLYGLIKNSIEKRKLDRQNLQSAFQTLAPKLFKDMYLPEWEQFRIVGVGQSQVAFDANNGTSSIFGKQKVGQNMEVGGFKPRNVNQVGSTNTVFANSLMTLPIIAEKPVADIRVGYTANRNSSMLSSVNFARVEHNNVVYLESQNKVPAGSYLKFDVNTGSFVYIFAFNHDINDFELLYPFVKPNSEQKNIKISVANPSDFMFTQTEAGLSLPMFEVDEKGGFEKCVVLVSNSVITSPVDFAKNYLKVEMDLTKKKNINIAFDSKDPRYNLYSFSDEKINLNEVVKIYNITLNK